ncbi:ubiquitin-associated domain-containing protein 2-like [Ylistrum balloti]|uniref:ubiquitin-associated domain-containing protein 2-like n=1 Tax=Ylistrum balloti TaxID=509963 RepID=UPI002905DACE|nr:ubiquitin-associated domain-containing protein 2-like [Ylistrum balloti]
MNDYMGPMHSASGFYKTPVSKGLLGVSLLSSFLLNFPLHNHRHLFLYSQAAIVERHQFWRLLTSKLAYLDIKDLFVCSLLIYYFRVFERRYGSHKFASYMLATFVVGTGLEMAAAFFLRWLGFKYELLPSGPMCMVYPLFIPYHLDIPRVAFGHILGVPVTGKSFQYFLGLQLASGSAESILVAVCGLFCGILWRIDFLKVQTTLKIPKFVASLSCSTLGRILESKAPSGDNTPMGATLELQRQEQMEHLEQQMIWQAVQQQQQGQNINMAQNLVNGPGLFGNQIDLGGLRNRLNIGGDNPPGQAVEEPITEENVQHLVDMGFGADRVREALQASNNNVSAATHILLQDS